MQAHKVHKAFRGALLQCERYREMRRVIDSGLERLQLPAELAFRLLLPGIAAVLLLG